MADMKKAKRLADRRKAERRDEKNEITLTVLSDRGNIPKGKVIYNFSKDMSASGARIQSNIFLPVDTLLNVEYTVKNRPQLRTAIGKVKWVKSLFADDFFEAGLEFVYTPENWSNN